MIELKTADGATIGAYRAMPNAAPKGGVVVVQEIFGVNHHIRAVADRFAANGYVALAPAIFDRAERGVELAYDAAGGARGIALAKAIPQDQHLLSVEAAIAALDGTGPLAVVGYCLGGTLAFAAATRSPRLSAAVAYYGGGIAGMTGANLLCPVEMHFGEKDDHIPPHDVAKVKAAYPELPIFTYPAGHGFNCDERGSYDEASAELAWTRTLSFLEREIQNAA